MRRTIASVFGLLLATLGAAPPPGFPELYKTIKPSVVYVLTTLPSGTASGSGFVYDSDASQTIIVTAAHVIANAQHVDVVLDSDKSKRVPAKILQNDAKRDVAFLSIAVGNRKPLKMADRDQIVEGTTIAAIGYPRASLSFERYNADDLRPSVHMGIISAVRVNGELIQIDALTDHGDSGGPVIDSKTGRVIGIVRGALIEPSGLATGVQNAIPGTSYAASSTVIYGVRNGLMTSTAVAGASKPGSVAAAAAGASNEYRVAFVTAPVPVSAAPNAATIAAITAGYTRFRSHFTADNSLYAIPAAATIMFSDASALRSSCDDLRVNGVLYPSVQWLLKDGTLKTTAGFYVEDCNGVPFYGHVVKSTRDRVSRLTV